MPLRPSPTTTEVELPDSDRKASCCVDRSTTPSPFFEFRTLSSGLFASVADATPFLKSEANRLPIELELEPSSFSFGHLALRFSRRLGVQQNGAASNLPSSDYRSFSGGTLEAFVSSASCREGSPLARGDRVHALGRTNARVSRRSLKHIAPWQLLTLVSESRPLCIVGQQKESPTGNGVKGLTHTRKHTTIPLGFSSPRLVQPPALSGYRCR